MSENTDQKVAEAAARTGVAPPEGEPLDQKKEDSEAAGGRKKPPSRSGPRKKSAGPPPVMPPDQWATVVGGLLDMICEAWRIPPRKAEQKKALSAASQAVIDKHLSIGEHTEEIALAIVALSVGAPMVIEKISADRERELEELRGDEEEESPPPAIV